MQQHKQGLFALHSATLLLGGTALFSKLVPLTTLGIISGVGSALLFTLRNILYKHKLSQYSGPQTMFYQTLVNH